MMDIDRLKTDAAYWPKWASHYSNISNQFLRLGEDGKWWRSDGVMLVRHRVSHESCIPRPSAPEWDGEGLPPVGWSGEYTKPSGFVGRKCVWRQCVVVAHDCGGALIRTDKGRYHLLTVPEYEFRVIKAKYCREKNKLSEIIEKHSVLQHWESDEVADAIIAAGYRKQERD